jgi:hypothetical protein
MIRRLERRGARRIAPSRLTPCLLTLPEEQVSVEALVHNLSLTGVGLLLDRPLTEGACLALLLVNAGHIRALTLELTVIRCVRIYTGEYFVGGRFSRKLTSIEITPFLI